VVVGALLRHKTVGAAVALAETTLKTVGLGTHLRGYPGDLGLVDRARLEVARALATEPRVLLLDEVMAGLTPSETIEAVEMIRSIKARGISVLVVEHNMKAIMSVSDRIVAFDHGAKIAEGTPEQVSNNPLVIESYLGADSEYAQG
jgi:branched-chain amino acid transport system ATP-binding protein